MSRLSSFCSSFGLVQISAVAFTGNFAAVQITETEGRVKLSAGALSAQENHSP